MEREHVGHTTIGRTVHEIFRLEVGENSRHAGIRHNLALVGPRGAYYLVTDFGPKFKLNSVACGGSTPQSWTPVPRELRGLTRAHLAFVLEGGAA